MRLLFVTIAFAPDEFSEAIVNSKLVLALKAAGHDVDVLSRKMDSTTYNSDLQQIWSSMMINTNQVNYAIGNRFSRYLDCIICSWRTLYPFEGTRWISRTVIEAEKLIHNYDYDFIITRSPSDIPHIVGLRLKEKYNIKWIANFNDPSSGIWPKPYEEKMLFWKRFFLRKITQKILDKADSITFPSLLLSEHFGEFFTLNKTKVAIIPHITLNITSNESTQESTSSIRLAHSGNLSVERDPRNLLLAIKKFNNSSLDKVYLDFIGVVSDNYKSLIIEMGLDEYVKLIKPLPYSLTLQKLSSYDVLVILEAIMDKSIFLPSKISDYVQLQKPVLSISPKISEVGRLIHKYGGGIMACNASENDILEKLTILSNLKSKHRLNDLLCDNALRDYFNDNWIINLIERL